MKTLVARFACFCVLVAGAVYGQGTSGQITGTVTDASAAAVQGAAASISNDETGLKRQSETNERGAYSFPLLPPGAYRVSVMKPGFRPMTRTGLDLAVDQTVCVDFALEVGAIAETVEVSASAPVVDQDTSALGQLIDSTKVADDMGFSDVGCYGGEIRTPNIDSLARSGVRSTQFYNTARCCPTRASLLTGLYPHQAGVGHMVDNPRPFPGYRGDLSRRAVTIAEALKPAGYQTLMSGKWHVTPVNDSKHNWPRQRGFDRYYWIIHGAADYFNPVTLVRDNEKAELDRPNYYFTDAIAGNASNFIAEAARKPEPPGPAR